MKSGKRALSLTGALLAAFLLSCFLSACGGEEDATSRMTLGESVTETETKTETETETETPPAEQMPRLEMPVPIFNYETAVLSWEPVEHAVGYVVTVNGEALAEQTATSYAFEADGTYTVTVRAIAPEGHRNSRASDPLTFTIGWSNVPVV